MGDIAIDDPDCVIDWFASYPEAERARKVIGECPHACPHNMTATVGWGPDLAHYELHRCDVRGPDGCNRNCRGWCGPPTYARMATIDWKLLGPVSA